MAKPVSIPVSIEMQANPNSMKAIVAELEKVLGSAKTGSALERSLRSALDQARDALSGYEQLVLKPTIDKAGLVQAERYMNRFASNISKMHNRIVGANFSNFNLTDDQKKNLEDYNTQLKDLAKNLAEVKRSGTKNQAGQYLAVNNQGALLKEARIKSSRFKDTDSLGRNAENIEKEAAAERQRLTNLQERSATLATEITNLESQLKASKANLKKAEKDASQARSMNEKAEFFARYQGVSGRMLTDAGRVRTQNSLLNQLMRPLETYYQDASTGRLKDSGVEGAKQLFKWMSFSDQEIDSLIGQQISEIRSQIAHRLGLAAADSEVAPVDWSRIERITDQAERYASQYGSDTVRASRQQKIDTYNNLNAQIVEQQKNLDDKKIEQTDVSDEITRSTQLINDLNNISISLKNFQSALDQITKDTLQRNIDDLNQKVDDLKAEVRNDPMGTTSTAVQSSTGIKDRNTNIRATETELIDSGAKAQQEAQQFKENLQASVRHWMGAQQIITLVKQGIRQAYQDIQGLDKAMTNIAVVTDYSVSDLWGKINEYMSVAQQYGVTTQGVYEVSQLYFQQGLGEADTMAATTETLKMARIAGMGYAEAADGMTVAIRGFNMEMQDAARVTDVYSKVAAITASDTQELVTAMSKTASSAAAVGSSFENTTAMLAVMIEATRESPQNLGSALKSIISRYGEMTKGVDVDEEGEEIDYNRVDTALKTVGISLKDAQGQFRDFDTVIEELSAKWTTLDSVTQRYIATIFAGNRQQSRFLALVSNYDRYMEVSEAAASSEDAGLLQYSKTLDSLETKLNNIKTSFQQFYMDIFDGPTVGKVLEFINDLIKGFNKLGKITSIINIASIIGAIKVVGTVLVSHFATTFSQIANAWKNTLKDMSTQTQSEAQIAGQKWYQGFVSKSGNGKTTLSQKGTKVVSGAMLLGSGLTMAGSSIAEKDQTAGAWLSAGGNALSIGAQLAMINPYLGIIGGLVAGLVTLFTSLPTDLEKAQQELEKNSKKAEEANIKRAEAKEKARGMESTIQELKELERSQYDSVEAQKAYIDAQNSAAETYPELVTTFDLAGNAIIDTIAAENNLAKAREQAAEAAYEAAAAERQKKLSEQAENWEQLWAASGIGTSNLSKYEGEDVRNSSYFIAGLMGTGLTKRMASLTGKEISFSGDLTAQNPEIVKALGMSSGISEEFFNLISSTKNLSLPEILSQFDQAFQNGVLDFLFEIPQIEGMSDADKEKMRTALYENAVTNFLSSSKLIGEGETAQTYRDKYLPNLQALSSNQAAIEDSNEGVVAQYLNKKLETTFLNEGNRFGKWQEGFENADLRLIVAITDKINPQELKYDSTGKIADTTSIDAIYDSTVQTFTNFYDSIASSFNTEKFNELIQQGEIGKVTSAEFINQFQNLTGLNQEQIEANEAANSYLTAFTEWQSQVFSRAQTSLTQDSRKINWEEVMPEGESLTSFLEQIPGYYYTEIVDFANYIDKQLESGTLSNNQAKDIVTAYAGLWSSLDDSALGLTPEQLGQARAILEKADFTSIEGITNLIDELSKLGIDTSKINFKIGEDTFNIADFPIYTSNLISEWENLKNKLVTNTESLIKDLQNASQGMSLEDALSMAKKMNLDLGEDFQFIDGEWFTTNTAAIETYYTEKANEYKAQLLEEATRAQEKLGSMDQRSYDSFLSGGKTNLSEEDLEVYNLLEKYWTEDTKKYYDKWLKIDGNSHKGMAGFWSDYFASLGEDVDDATQKALEYYKEQADKEVKIATDGANLRTKAKNAGVDFDAIEARETIKSKGKYGYSPEEIASLQEALGLVEGVDYSLNTKTGSYDFTDVGLDKVGSEIRQIIELSAQQEAEAALDSLADLGSSIGSGEAKASDYAEAFSYLTEVRGYTSEQVKDQITRDYLEEDQKALKIRFARQASYMATGSIDNWEDYKDEAEEAVEEFNANMVDSSKESIVKYYNLLQKKILGTITNQELEELGDFKPADLGLDTTEFTGNLISQLTQHAQAIINGLASGTIVDFEAATDTLEKDMTAALSAKAYAKEFNIDESLIEGMDSLTLAYFSDAMETVRKSKNQFDADSAGKIATSIATMMGAGEEVASKVLDLFAYDLEEHSFSLELPSSFDELKKAFGLEESGAAATAIEQAYANQQKQVVYAGKKQNRTGLIASAFSMTDVKAFTRGTFEQAEETIKNDASLSEEARQKALAEVQALRYFWEAAGEAEISAELEKFDESRAFIDGLKSTYETLASGEEITAAELKEIYEGLGQELDEGETYQDIIKQGSEAVLNNIIETIKAAAESGDISQNEAAEQLAELQAIVLDAIISNISSGISSLGSGLEGTLGAADYQSLAKKYGLTGVGTSKSSKGIRLGAADQQKLISRLYLEAASQGLQAEFGDQIWEAWRDSTEDAFEGYTDIEKAIQEINKQLEVTVDKQSEAYKEAEAYRDALQQARHAAMFDEDAIEFAFMEQDATDGLTKNFDKFVDNIDKVKSAFSSFQSGEAIGYQDFYNMMDYMNKFGADGGTNSFIKTIENAGHTYEDFVNSVVANTDTFGKVDIGGVAAELGISVDAAMQGMAEGMTESLKEVARQQIKYLSSLEAMLEALLILESIGEISFGLNMSIDIDGDGINDLNFATYGDLFDWYEKLPPEQQKTMMASIKLGFENRYGKETGGNIFSALFGDGDIDFLDKALGSVLDNEKLFNKFKQDINDPNGVFKKIMSKVGEDGSLGEGLGLAVMDAFNIEGVKWEDMFSWGEDNSITGWGSKLLEAIGDPGLTPEQLTEKIFGTLLNIDPNTITASFASKLSGQTISLEGMEPFKLGMGADGGIQLPEDVTISPDNMSAFQSQIESIIGKEITNLSIGEDGKITFDLASTAEGVEQINTDFQTAAEAASTLQTAITQISSVASAFQAGSGFQSLADQLNAAADAAERLAGALGIEIKIPEVSEVLSKEELEAQLIAAQQAYEKMGQEMMASGQVDYTQLDAAQDKVLALQEQLNNLSTTGDFSSFSEQLTVILNNITSISSTGDPFASTTSGAIAAYYPLYMIWYSLINTLTQLNQIKSNDALVQMSTDATIAMDSIMAIDGAVETLRTGLEEDGPIIAESLKVFESQGAIDLATNIDKAAQSLQTMYDLLSQVGEDGTNPLMTLFSGGLFGQTQEGGAEGGIFAMLEQLSTSISTLDASQITAIATAISSINTNVKTASTSMTSLQQAIGKLQSIKTKIELETNAEDTKKEIQSVIDAIGQIDIAIGIGVAQSGSEEVTDALTDVDEAENSIARSIGINVYETGSAQVAEKLREVDEAENSIARNITIKVKVEGAPEAIGMLNSIKGATGTGRYAGTVNNISGNALAEGNILRRHLLPGANLANKTLVGELGPELAVYNGKYHLLGAGGAEFVTLPKGALVFNHLQTRGILNGQMNGARAETYQGYAKGIQDRMHGSAMVTGNVTGPALASGIAGALAAVRRAKSVWQGLLNSLSAADLLGGGGGGGGGGGDDNSLKAHIADLQEWYNLSRQIADIEGQINILLAKRKSITDGHEYLRNLRQTQKLLEDQVNTQEDLLRFQELQLQRQADHINTNKIWSQFLEVDENGLLQYKEGNETNGGKGALEVLQRMNKMSGSEQLAYVKSLGWSYTTTDDEELEDEELVAKFFEELQKQIDDYDALRDTVVEAEEALADLEEEIRSIDQEIRENEMDLSQEIYDIIVKTWEENIENLKEQNELIKEANEAYANGIQEAIDVERRMYEQNTAIADREQLQRQLALKRRSGGSASEIADLEKQLDGMFQDEYFSNQENALENIREANENQAKLLDQQVKIQEELLKYEQDNGVIWQKVYEVMSGTDAEITEFMMGNSTEFFKKSALQQEDMLTDWAKKIGIYTEERQRQNYAAEAMESFESNWQTKEGKDLKSAFESARAEQQANWKREFGDTYASAIITGKSPKEALELAQKEMFEHIKNWIKERNDSGKAFKRGGLINYTGPAWVDGSKSKPERILSAEQNRILEEGLAMAAGRSETLKDAFNSFASNLGASIRNSIANITNNIAENKEINIASGAIVLQVQQLNDQYDIDELYNDITNKVYSIAARASGRSVSRR